ncbi:MAG: sugar ABC transporter permease [Calditrichaeota bacterium]|nr:MAG: sugar ABC transporter permease [Calditrichota bacterium]
MIQPAKRTVTGIVKRIYRENLWSYFFISPALVLFLVMTCYPLIQAAIMAFYTYDRFKGGSISHPLFVGWSNYHEVLRSPVFWKSMRNTLIFAGVVVPVSTGMTLFLSFLIHPLHRAYQSFFKSAFYLPGIASEAVLALIWFWIFNPAFGVLNYFLSRIGLGPIYWLADAKWALPSIILMAIVSGWGINVIIFTTAIDHIPGSLYEAAKIDGANSRKQFWHITLPLLRPATLFVLVMGTISSLQVFTPIYMLTRGGPNNATKTVVYLIYETAFQFQQLGKAAAQAFVLFVLIILFTMIQFRFLQPRAEF